jgi:hypothetical protein
LTRRRLKVDEPGQPDSRGVSAITASSRSRAVLGGSACAATQGRESRTEPTSLSRGHVPSKLRIPESGSFPNESENGDKWPPEGQEFAASDSAGPQVSSQPAWLSTPADMWDLGPWKHGKPGHCDGAGHPTSSVSSPYHCSASSNPPSTDPIGQRSTYSQILNNAHQLQFNPQDCPWVSPESESSLALRSSLDIPSHAEHARQVRGRPAPRWQLPGQNNDNLGDFDIPQRSRNDINGLALDHDDFEDIDDEELLSCVEASLANKFDTDGCEPRDESSDVLRGHVSHTAVSAAAGSCHSSQYSWSSTDDEDALNLLSIMEIPDRFG